MNKKRNYDNEDELPKALREMQEHKNNLYENQNNDLYRDSLNSNKLNENEQYNDKEVHSRKAKRRLKKPKAKKSKFKKTIIILIILLIIVCGVKLGISAHIWKTLAVDMSKNESSIVVDQKNNKIATIGDERKKSNLSSSEIPTNLKNAYVAIEDERFYKHGGVDVKRTTSAIFSYIIHFGSSSFGGSTITQQLVKNLTGDTTDSISRKVNEWWKAEVLETAMSKDEILTSYLNIIYTGPNIYGVQNGAKYYFNKSVSELNLAETAFLAGINNSPNSYNPFGEKDNTEKIKNRTKNVLNKMKDLKYISDNECETAIDEVDKGLNFKNGDVESKSNGVYSYHTDALITEAISDVEDKYNISEKFATNYINMAGLTIKSTQDSNIQKEMETEVSKKKYILKSQNGTDTSQTAMVIIDHKTGQVLGCIGGIGNKTEARPFNRATQSVRQTGSSIKPIAVLAPGIDKRDFTASTIFDDTEQDFKGNYHPVDYIKPLGKITVRRAVESSQNIPFVEMMEKIGPSTSIKYMEKMGITSLTKNDNNLSLALGGLDKGISPLQMAGAYATIANDGKYIEPIFYTEIDKSNGTTILKAKQTKRQVFSKDVAYIIKELLTQPVQGVNGTATYCKINGVDVAAKTGTTDENYDRWLCGFTPYYTAVTWYGYDQNETVNFNHRNPAGLIWANVMARIHTGLQSAKFVKPVGVTAVTVCTETGQKATTGCPNTYTEYFLWLTIPGLCDKHQGSELKPNNNNNTNTNVTDIIKGITNDIDSTEPDSSTEPIEENNSSNENTRNNQNSNTTTNNERNTSTENNRTNTNRVRENENTTQTRNTTNETRNNETRTNTSTNRASNTQTSENSSTNSSTSQNQSSTSENVVSE